MRLADELNYGEYLDENFSPSEFNKKIIEISFHHNLIVVMKRNNDQVPVIKAQNVSELKKPMDSHPNVEHRLNVN